MKRIVSSFVTAGAVLALSCGAVFAYSDGLISTADDSVTKIDPADGSFVYVFTNAAAGQVTVTPQTSLILERALVVGGGGAGGWTIGGGGGGGAVVSLAPDFLVDSDITLAVGAGGISPDGAGWRAGGDGGSSTLAFGSTTTTALGGGGGGSWDDQPGHSGANGGGSSHGNGTEALGTQGNKGAAAVNEAPGGGGGAGSAGHDSPDGGNTAGSGGDGIASDITGTSAYYGGGGGGGGGNSCAYGGTGGLGGGASGRNANATEATNKGVDGLGGGGAGGSWSGGDPAAHGGNGGCGTVILRIRAAAFFVKDSFQGNKSYTAYGTIVPGYLPPMSAGDEYKLSLDSNYAAGSWIVYSASDPMPTFSFPAGTPYGDVTVWLHVVSGGNVTSSSSTIEFIDPATVVPIVLTKPHLISSQAAANGATILPADIDNGSHDDLVGIYGMGVTPSVVYGAGTVTLSVTNNLGVASSATAAISVLLTDYFVSSNGSDSTGDGSSASPWRTISHALSEVGDNGIILHVAPGTYDAAAGETFPIQPRSNILVSGGTSASDVVIDATGATASVLVLSGNSGSPLLANITVVGGKGTDFADCSGYLITNCVFTGSTTSGAKIENSPNATFVDCIFTNNTENGLWFHKCNSLTLDHCAFANNRGNGLDSGVYGWFIDAGTSPYLTARYCYFGGNQRYGATTWTSQTYNWTFDHCTFNANLGTGFGIEYPTYYENSFLFTNCIFTANGGYGLFMHACQMYAVDSLFYGNITGPIWGSDGQSHATNADLGGCLYDDDPLLCPAVDRVDGAVYIGSPALGAAKDGSNFGCYQGQGEGIPAGVTYYVRADGNDANDGSENTSGKAFATFARGAQALSRPGDTLHVGPGLYTDAVVINGLSGSVVAPVVIECEEGTVLSVSGVDAALKLTGCERVNISGLSVLGGAGVSIECVSCLVSNCVVGSCSGTGLTMMDSPSSSVIDCVFTNNAAHGLWFYRSGSMAITRCTAVQNGQSGICGGHGGWQGGNACAGTRGSYCYLAYNGKNGIQFNVDNVDDWVFDHCTIIGNGVNGFGPDAGDPVSGIGRPYLRDCIVANNTGCGLYMNRNTVAATNTVFWMNAAGDIGGGSASAAADLGDCTYDVDPLLCPTANRTDGAVFDVSPVILAASDGGNIGCYQGPGEASVFDSDVYYVRYDGNDANDGLSNDSAGAFATVAHGVQALRNPGDVLHVGSGLYTDAAVISGAIGLPFAKFRIEGEPGAILAATGVDASLKLSNCQNFIIAGLAFEGGAGLVAEGGSSVTITNCVFSTCTTDGMKVAECELVIVADCVSTNNAGEGLWVYGTPNMSILDSVFAFNTKSGIAIGRNVYGWNEDPSTCPGMDISNCYVAMNGEAGIGIATSNPRWFINHCTILGNDEHGIGPASSHLEGISTGNTVTNCIVAYNGNCGVVMDRGTWDISQSFFWGNANQPVACAEADRIPAAKRTGYVEDQDPQFFQYETRIDGMVYGSSPVIGAATDGSNIGFYQGQGIPSGTLILLR